MHKASSIPTSFHKKSKDVGIGLCIYDFENFFNRHEPTLKAHVSIMCRSFTWGTHIEIEAVACLFQVPVYECVQFQDGNTYHWEVHHPRAQADQFAFLLL